MARSFEVASNSAMSVDREFKLGRFACGVVCNPYGDVKGCVSIFPTNGTIAVNWPSGDDYS